MAGLSVQPTQTQGSLSVTSAAANAAKQPSLKVVSSNDPRSILQPGQVATSATPAAASAPAAPDPQAAAYAAMAAETRRQNALLQQQIAAAPRLVKYDTAGAAASSLSEATQYQTPLYTQRLNDYLAKTAIARNAENRHATETIQDARDQLAANLEGSATNRTRTSEDVAAKIGEANYQQGNFLDASGTAFDEARRNLQSGTAAAGLAESGLGAQKLDSQQAAQGADSNTQVHGFEQVRKAADLFKNRTFEDLAKSDELNKTLTDKTTSRTKLNLEDFLANDKINEAQTRSDIELQRQSAILLDTQTRKANKADAFIASLINSGARPQDIAFAKNIYG